MKHIRVILTTFFLAVLFLFLLGIIFHFGLFYLYDGKIYPRVYLGNQALGGKSGAEAKSIVGQSLAKYEESSLDLVSQDFEMRIPLSGLEMQFDEKDTYQKAYLLGRSGNLIQDFLDELSALLFSCKIMPAFTVNQDLTSQLINALNDKINESTIDAGFVISDKELLLRSEAYGCEVDLNKFNEIFLRELAYLENRLEIPVERREPKIKIADIQALLPEAQEVIAKPLNLSFADQVWEIQVDEVRNFLAFDFVKSEQGTTLLPYVKNRDFLLQKVREKTAGVKDQFQSVQLKQIGDKTVAIEIPKEGKVLDLEKTVDAVDAYYQMGAEEESVALAVVLETPEMLKEKGIINASQLIGFGESHFPIGWGQMGRVHNIETAAAKLNDYLVAPGETFSTNIALGEISYQTGYWGGLALIGNRYVGAIGGGVCEIATVLFRAALNSGLKINSRTPHATVIYHYDWPQRGIDATIFPDTGLDFSFINDTAGYILVQTKVQGAEGVLRIEFWSDEKRREVTLSASKVENVVAPGEPLLITDATLKPGEKKLTEVQAEGCDVEVTRTIKERGSAQEEIIKSHYRPWRAVYLVGE